MLNLRAQACVYPHTQPQIGLCYDKDDRTRTGLARALVGGQVAQRRSSTEAEPAACARRKPSRNPHAPASFAAPRPLASVHLHPHHAHGAPPGSPLHRALPSHRQFANQRPHARLPRCMIPEMKRKPAAGGPAEPRPPRARETCGAVRCGAGVSPRARPDPATATFPLALANHTPISDHVASRARLSRAAMLSPHRPAPAQATKLAKASGLLPCPVSLECQPTPLQLRRAQL